MSMTAQSKEYFRNTAGQWDEIRAGYFGEAIRDAAIRKAYLRPEMVVADVGAGSGYLSAGLAPLVRKVWALDGSDEMLNQARHNLGAYENVEFKKAEGLALPLEDQSVDAVFANMYLHHIPEPEAAIREMARILRPGGRLILTDMDRHPYEWFREEMADVWLGFERADLSSWFEGAGLVNVMAGASGESCQAETLKPEKRQGDEQKVQISVLLAVGTKATPGVKEAVKADYGAAAREGNSCCAPEAGGSCCGGSEMIALDLPVIGEVEPVVEWVTGYSSEELANAPTQAAEFSLGCGNPTALANLGTGETVLDIGSGGGLDAFLAAKQVGPTGSVIGVDMTPEMLERARHAAANAGIANVEFRQGEAESLPVEAGTIDVILSNCVINLVEDKARVFNETYRALRPGGRLEISDMVTETGFLPVQSGDAGSRAGCVFGALPESEYCDLVRAAGFTEVEVRRSNSAGIVDGTRLYSIHLTARKP